MTLPLPPAVPGWPLVGNIPAFARSPSELFRRGYEAFGRVFSIRLGSRRAVVLIGPENHRFFFTQTDDTLTLQEVYKFVVPMFGRVLQAAPPRQYAEQRALFQPAFAAARMGFYVELMEAETSAWLAGLGRDGTFDLWGVLEKLSMSIAASCLLGPDLRRRLGPEFWALYRDVAGGMDFLLPPSLPLPKFRRRDRAKAGLLALMRPLIADRRARPSGSHDILQVLAEATYPDGRPVPEETLLGLLLILVFAAYETTAAQMGWALVDLLRHPAYLARVREEIDGVLRGEETITPEKLKKLDVFERGLKETERMRPITTMLWRHTARAYELGGYHIPAGWITMICPPVSHRLPDVFRDPDVYDPDRFALGRAEDRKTPFALVNFGGGDHRCPGLQFAYAEMKVVLGRLLTSYKLRLPDAGPAIDYSTGIARPRSPYLVAYERDAVARGAAEAQRSPKGPNGF